MDSTPKKQQRSRLLMKKEDLKPFDPLATPSPKKSESGRPCEQRKSIEVTVEPLFNTRTRVPFTGVRGNCLRMTSDTKTPANRVGRFCIVHMMKSDQSPESPSDFNESAAVTPSKSEDDSIMVLSPAKAKSGNRDILDILF